MSKYLAEHRTIGSSSENSFICVPISGSSYASCDAYSPASISAGGPGSLASRFARLSKFGRGLGKEVLLSQAPRPNDERQELAAEPRYQADPNVYGRLLSRSMSAGTRVDCELVPHLGPPIGGPS